jgi:hypothetical protein
LGRELRPAEIEKYPDIQSLINDIVRDLVQLYQRIEPHLPVIYKMLQIGQTTDRQTRSRAGSGFGDSNLDSADARPRLPIEAEIFLAEIVEKYGQPESEPAATILRWALTETDSIQWHPEFTPTLSIGAGCHQIVTDGHGAQHDDSSFCAGG